MGLGTGTEAEADARSSSSSSSSKAKAGTGFSDLRMDLSRSVTPKAMAIASEAARCIVQYTHLAAQAGTGTGTRMEAAASAGAEAKQMHSRSGRLSFRSNSGLGMLHDRGVVWSGVADWSRLWSLSRQCCRAHLTRFTLIARPAQVLLFVTLLLPYIWYFLLTI